MNFSVPLAFERKAMKDTFDQVYFIGIGGIGMSALARYFRHEGKQVGGYDLTPTPLTSELEAEGMDVHYTDDPDRIPAGFREAERTLVVYTPAVPSDHRELNWFLSRGFETVKRSQMLGAVSRGKYVMAVAGTHGKTTTSTLLAHFNRTAALGPDGSRAGGSAFLGGISRNFDSNLVLGKGDRLVVEADEFDRSFLQLRPDVALVTSMDADHLDIYHDHASLKAAFADFAAGIREGGALVRHKGLDLEVRNAGVRQYTYACEGPADFHADRIVREADGRYRFDIVCPDRTLRDCRLGIPGRINVENCVGAAALMWCAGFDEDRLREAVASFRGVRRRFDFHLNTPRITYMDDYAHHPQELRAALTSLREMFPGRRIAAVFQPHLYTRTRDFAAAFAASLSLADRVLLLPIYPAREEPIEGVSSGSVLERVERPCKLVRKEDLAEEVKALDEEVIVTFGAGDIGACCGEVAEALREKYGLEG